MIGLLLVAHAGLARELLSAAEMIVGKIDMAEAVGIGADDSVDTIRDAISGAIKTLGGDGVLIMTECSVAPQPIWVFHFWRRTGWRS